MHNIVFRLSWIQRNGTVYKTGALVVLDVGLTPVFGKICDLVAINTNDTYLVCEVMFTVRFNHHFHSYEVSLSSPINYVLCKPSDLVDHNVLGLYRSQFVSLKYYNYY